MLHRMSTLLITVLLFFTAISVFSATPKTFNVMTPLELPAWYYSIRTGKDYMNNNAAMSQDQITNYQNQIEYFKNQLKAAKAIGVNAVSTDVWWGMVESTNDQFVWDDFKSIFQDIVDAGLQIMPIMSFHQCGGNVGDDVNVNLPSWIWDIAGDGAKYISEQLYTNGEGTDYSLNPTIPSHTKDTLLTPEQESIFGNSEVVSLWATNKSAVHEQYQQYMQAFEKFVTQEGFADDIQSISISCGPSGECRYPSYDTYSVTSDGVTYNIGAGWPSRGFLMCYSANAFTDFQDAMHKKYGTISALNKAWNTKPTLSSFSDVTPPKNGDSFFQYAVETPRPQYAIDLINWYNSSLIQHGQAMLTDALIAFCSGLKSVTVGNKIPGITWQMGSTTIPRSAEICAGLIPGSFQQNVYDYGCGPEVDQGWSNQSCGQDYSGLLKMVYGMNTDSNNTTNHPIQLYFTCLEQPNMDYSAQGYSWPATLVYCVGQEANEIGLSILGENALAPNNGWGYANGGLSGVPIGNKYWGLNSGDANSSNTSAYSWSILLYALSNANFQGVNILRVENLTTLGQGMYGNYYGLIYHFNQGDSGVPNNVPQISSWEVGPANNN